MGKMVDTFFGDDFCLLHSHRLSTHSDINTGQMKYSCDFCLETTFESKSEKEYCRSHSIYGAFIRGKLNPEYEKDLSRIELAISIDELLKLKEKLAERKKR